MEKLPLILSTYWIFLICLSKTCEIRGRAIFGPQGHNLSKLGRGSLNDATYVI